MTSGEVPIQASAPASGKKSDLTEYWRKLWVRDLDAPFRFDILAQLANILARITIHELLHLSKETREALRDVLANSESFLMHMPEASEDDSQPLCPECHHVQPKIPSITFITEDMLLKDNKHDLPLYYTVYIGSTYIERVQVDPGFALSIIPKRLLYFFGIPLNKLLTTTSMIYGFNAGVFIHWERFSSLLNWGSKIRCDVLRHRCWHVIQSTAGTTLDSRQLDHFLYSASVLQVCGW